MKLEDFDKEKLYYLASPYSTPKWKTLLKYNIGNISQREMNVATQGYGAKIQAQNAPQFTSVTFNGYNEVAYEGDAALMLVRYNMIEHVGTFLIKRGFCLIEPISMCYNKSQKYNLPQEFKYWEKRDKRYIDACDGGILVAAFDGWEHSTGVTAEIDHAIETSKPVYILKLNFKNPDLIEEIEVLQ